MFYPSVRAAQASHTRLCQLADFPSLILRSSFAQGSLNLRHILGCASSPTFLRLSFAQPSLNLRSGFAGGNYEF